MPKRNVKFGLKFVVLAFLTALLSVQHSILAAEVDRILFVMPYGEAVSETYLRSRINMVSGSEFSPDLLADDIARLHATGIVADVDVSVEAADHPGKVNVRFVITPVPEIGEIVVEGNRRVRTARILKKFSLQPGQRLDVNRLAEGRRETLRLYQQRAFDQATINLREEPMEDGRVRVRIEIDEGARHKIRAVHFVGNDAFSDRRLRRVIRSRARLLARVFSTGYLDQARLTADRQRLRQLYEQAGYLDFRIERIDKSYSDDEQWATLTFHLDEGEPYQVSSVEIIGHQEFSEDELRAGLTLTENMRYNPETQDRDVQWISGRYHERGFLDLVCRPILEQNPERATVDITYQIREGRQFWIRDISIVGNTLTQDHVIRREVAVQPGDLADLRKIETTRSRLRELQYFRQVLVTPLPTEEEDRKDLEIAVEEQDTGSLGLGGGVSTDAGFFGFIEIQERNFDLAKLLRFRDWPPKGGGQRLGFMTRLGTERSEFVLSFVEPWLSGYRLSLQTSLYMRLFDQVEYREERLGGSVGLTREFSLGPDRLGRRPWWRRNWRLSVGYQLDQVKLSGFSSSASPELQREKGDYTVSAISLGMGRDTRDSMILPTRGASYGMSLELQSEIIGAYTNLYKLHLHGSRYYPLSGCRWLAELPIIGDSVLKINGQVATVDNFSGAGPAIFDRYTAGGQYSLRGFDRRQISPTDSRGKPLGGRSKLLGGVEMMYPLHRQVWVAAFADFGNVWRGSWDWQPGDLNSSLGVGLQLDLWGLPVRLDYGVPVVTQQGHLDTGGRLHFSLGRTF